MMRKLLLLSLLPLTACSLIPAYHTPNVGLPANWKTPTINTTIPLEATWWQRFNSPELNSLVTQAIAQNTSLQASLARIQQARGQLRSAGASLYPTASASAGAGRTERTQNNATTGSNSLSAGASMAYEVDLFGTNKANRTAARATLKGTEFQHQALQLTTAADVTSAYATLLSLRERTMLAEQNLKLSQDVLQLLEVRFNAGAISGLEVAQQRTAVASSQASLASLRQQQSAAQNALAILLGQTPQSFNVSATTLAALTLPQVPATQPATVIAHRPDVLAAEQALIAANANIGAARAAFLPSLSLGVGNTFAFDPAASTLNLTSSLLAPIFSGGSLSGNLLTSKARKQELLATYRGTVLTALQETEDALTAVQTTAARQTYQATAADQAQTAYNLTRIKLNNGAVDMLTLLDAQRSLLSAQDSAIQAKLDNLTAATNLIRALGGGWQ